MAAASAADVDALLHPELLSRDFIKFTLNQRNVNTGACGSREQLTELYLRHVIPLPQRTLPDNRWGRRMESSRGRRAAAAAAGRAPHSSSNDHSRKRPLIVFDGSSSRSAPLKVKKPEGGGAPSATTERLKPPPAANLSNATCKLSANSSCSSSTHRSTEKGNLESASDALKSPEVKKKIQHVTWP
ncbi:ashwin [Xenentodon cancila]